MNQPDTVPNLSTERIAKQKKQKNKRLVKDGVTNLEPITLAQGERRALHETIDQ